MPDVVAITIRPSWHAPVPAILALALFVLVAPPPPPAAAAQEAQDSESESEAASATAPPVRDTVWHQPPARSSAESDWLPQSLIATAGSIAEVDADTVRIQDAAGDVVNVATERIVWLEPDWQVDQAKQGMADFSSGRYAEAIPNLLAAIQQRPPVWQQQWLTGHLALAAAEADRYPAALELVQQLERSGAPTPMLALLPIRWTSRPASPAAVAAARTAIAAEQPTVRLVAASWLLSSATDRAMAERMLDALVENRATPTWVSQLAEAVRWRRTPVPQIAKASERWLEQIQRMPIILQGGPLLAAADRLQAAGEQDKARELYLSVALLYKKPRMLADQARTAIAEQSP